MNKLRSFVSFFVPGRKAGRAVLLTAALLAAAGAIVCFAEWKKRAIDYTAMLKDSRPVFTDRFDSFKPVDLPPPVVQESAKRETDIYIYI